MSKGIEVCEDLVYLQGFFGLLRIVLVYIYCFDVIINSVLFIFKYVLNLDCKLYGYLFIW